MNPTRDKNEGKHRRGRREDTSDHGYIIKIKIHSSCEIEYFVETHLCELCVILRSRVYRCQTVTDGKTS